jgi:DNA polymerase elongation subunit (family B)
MLFDDIHRLQLDIETFTEPTYRFSNASRPRDRIILIALADNRGWSHVIDGRKMDEHRMLQELVRLVVERDPDVLEGHNILNFDLPYILARCTRHEVEFRVGRDGSIPRILEGRTAGGDYGAEPTVSDIAGRHVVDTLVLVQHYDAGRRNMESYGLKYAARYFGLSTPDRVYVEGDRISWTWEHDPDTLLRYALDDVRETARLSEHLSPTSFSLAQMLPCSYGVATRMGAASKIELLMVREYLRQKQSLPKPSAGAQTSGGYTDIFLSGVAGPIVHADVESLYPSIMITRGIAPAKDELGVFTRLLTELTTQRLRAKNAMRESSDPIERSRLDAMQSSLKILVNSFYGYLGYGRALFNDFSQADLVTQTGQTFLRQIIAGIRERGGKVIEVDTDGVFFIPPPGVESAEQEHAFVSAISGGLPEGITLAVDGRYIRMLSYKKKNYALLGYDQRITVKGSSLGSRSMERFGRNFIRQCIERILHNDVEGVHKLYLEVVRAIQEHLMDVRDFARVEAVWDPIEGYIKEVQAGARNKSAAYEVARKSGRRVRPGDRIAYYIAGSDPNVKTSDNCKPVEEWDPHFPDENTAYYQKRLDEFCEKFRPFFRPQDYQRVFAVEDLFPFSSEGIILMAGNIEAGGAGHEEGPMAGSARGVP